MSDTISTRCSRKPARSLGTMRVRFTPAARPVSSAIAYVRRENPQAAVALRQRAADTLRRLEQFPESGRIIGVTGFALPQLVDPTLVLLPNQGSNSVWIVQHGGRTTEDSVRPQRGDGSSSRVES